MTDRLRVLVCRLISLAPSSDCSTALTDWDGRAGSRECVFLFRGVGGSAHS